MTNGFFSAFACAILIPVAALAQQASGASTQNAAAHPDLSGLWSYAIDRAPSALKKEDRKSVV